MTRTIDGLTVTYEIYGCYVPETKWARNGDPGSPGESPDVEISCAVDEYGNEVELDRYETAKMERLILKAEMAEMEEY